MKRIIYSAPVESMSGNLSGRQNLTYGGQGVEAYDIQTGSRVSADVYQPRIVAACGGRWRRNYFSVRTRSTVNMTARARLTMALMGGAGAIYAALLSDKTAQIYNDCVTAWESSGNTESFRAFMIRIIRPALSAKSATITIAQGVTIVNPWISSATPNVPVSQAVLDKFADVLSN